jgi:hypothetical protein
MTTTSYTVIIDDNLVPGITAAKDAYNIAHATDDGFVPLTDEQYVNFVMSMAAESYCRQFNTGSV